MRSFLASFAFAMSLAVSAQAMPVASVERPGDTVITVRELCGAGRHMVNGRCVATPARRAARRCAAGVTCN